tara:strand:- start:103 stop:1263 length:1161 start_codon:yes stop_codon:yes gene_type:complete
MKNSNIAIILSGGEGKRFDSKLPKQFFNIYGITVLELTLQKFLEIELFSEIILVCNEKYEERTKKIANNNKVIIVKGGKTRQKSVFNGLIECSKFNPSNVLIHDVVRPFFSNKLLRNILLSLEKNDSAIPAIDVKDSIRLIDGDSYNDINRKKTKLIQTPQGFNFKKIFKAHQQLRTSNLSDDSIIFKKNGNNVSIIPGEIVNFKITNKEDLEFGKMITNNINFTHIRVGHGFDVHGFKKGDKLILLGLIIPFNKSLEGHSDADVGYHTVVDAILGALSMGDIGEHFPPTEKKWKNKNSGFFVDFARDLLNEKGYKINNIDITLICEEPRIIDFKSEMIKNVTKILKIKKEIVNIKGTTTEKLGFLGRKEGIACQTTVTISKINEP